MKMRKRRIRRGPSKKYCRSCWDGAGHSVFPHYGVGPHICGYRMGKPVLGHSQPLPRELWPANFRADDAYPFDPRKISLGAWTHCLRCGAGLQENRQIELELDGM